MLCSDRFIPQASWQHQNSGVKYKRHYLNLLKMTRIINSTRTVMMEIVIILLVAILEDMSVDAGSAMRSEGTYLRAMPRSVLTLRST